MGDTLSVGQINQIRLSFPRLPEDWGQPDGRMARRLIPPLHLGLARGTKKKRATAILKRLMDIAGSLAALAVCLHPVLMMLAYCR